MNSTDVSIFDLEKQIDFDGYLLCGIVIVLNVETCSNNAQNLMPFADGFVKQIENGVYLEVFINPKNYEEISKFNDKLERFLLKKLDEKIGQIPCVLMINSTIRSNRSLIEVAKMVANIKTELHPELTTTLSGQISPLANLSKMPKVDAEWDQIMSLIFLVFRKIEKKVGKSGLPKNNGQKLVLTPSDAFLEFQEIAKMLEKCQKSFDPF